MAIDRSFIRVLAAWVSTVAILMAGHFCVVRGQAAADLAQDPAPYPATTDPNDPRPLSNQGSIVGWGSVRIDSSDFNARFIAIAAGGSHSLALKADGSMVGWGSNRSGQATPPDGNDFVAIAAGAGHSLALKADGSMVGWGTNTRPSGPWVGQATAPAGNDFVAIAAGELHSLALKADGSIVGWGYNEYGEYGQATPPEGNDFVAIAAGSTYSLAIRRAEPIPSP